MKRILLGTIAATAVVLLLFPTAGTPFTDTPDETDELVVSPADGPNGVYAMPDGDGDIHLNLSEGNQELAGDGVNENAVTEIDNIFTITYSGDDAAEVWLETEVVDAWFYRGSNPEQSLEGRENSVTLGESETVHVGLFIDTTASDHEVESLETFEIHAESEESTGDAASGTQEDSDDTAGGDGIEQDPATGDEPPQDPPEDDGQEQETPDEEEPPQDPGADPEPPTGDLPDLPDWELPGIDPGVAADILPDGVGVEISADETSADGEGEVLQPIDEGETEQAIGGTGLWIVLVLLLGGAVGASGATVIRRIDQQ